MFRKSIKIIKAIYNWFKDRFIVQALVFPFTLAWKVIKKLIKSFCKLIVEAKKYYFTHIVIIGTTAINLFINLKFILSMILASAAEAQTNIASTVDNSNIRETLELFFDFIALLALIEIISFIIALIISLLVVQFIPKKQTNNCFILNNKWYNLFYKINIGIITFSFIYWLFSKPLLFLAQFLS